MGIARLKYRIRTLLRVVTGRKRNVPCDPFALQEHLLTAMGVRQPLIFDVGANVGQTALRYRAHFSDAVIYCFEPFEDSVRQLREKLGADPMVHVVRNAVADTCGRRTFHVNNFSPTNSLLARPDGSRRYFPKSAQALATLDVDTITLDTFVREQGLEAPDILKLDIQGGELMALKGARDLLRTGGVSLVYTEAMFVPHYKGGPLLHNLWSLLQEYGYSLYSLYDLHRAENGQLRYADALFISSRLRSQVIDQYPEEP